MKAHITNQQVTNIPSTYKELREAYEQLLKMQEEYKHNVNRQAAVLAQELVQKDSYGAFARASNIWALALKRDGRIKQSTVHRIYKRITDEIIPQRARYVSKDSDDGASDDWLFNELDGFFYVDPRTEM